MDNTDTLVAKLTPEIDYLLLPEPARTVVSAFALMGAVAMSRTTLAYYDLVDDGGPVIATLSWLPNGNVELVSRVTSTPVTYRLEPENAAHALCLIGSMLVRHGIAKNRNTMRIALGLEKE